MLSLHVNLADKIITCSMRRLNFIFQLLDKFLLTTLENKQSYFNFIHYLKSPSIDRESHNNNAYLPVHHD